METKKILCVDDSNLILMMEKMILSKAGPYELVTAGNGEDAIAAARAEHPDLILMDVVMPKMNGFEACRHIREEEPDVPIIMVTTRGESQNVERGFLIGCTDYVTKPIDSIELLTKVRNCLGVE